MKMEELGSFMEEQIKRHAKQISQQKDSLLIEALKYKGFGHMIEQIKQPSMFKRIISIHYNDWEYIYVDDQTRFGKFIIAFSLSKPANDLESIKNGSYDLTLNLLYQSDNPLPNIEDIVENKKFQV